MTRRLFLAWLLLAFTSISCATTAPVSQTAGQSVLLVLAHPDDESVIGGVLGRLQKLGVPVYAVYMTRGEGSPVNRLDPEHKHPELSVSVLRPREMEGAAAFYGFKKYEFLDQKDAGYTTNVPEFLAKNLWDFPKIEAGVVKMAELARPTIVITMLPRHEHTHAHHQIAARVAISLLSQGRLGPRVEGLYGSPEIDWEEPGTFAVEEQIGLHFPRTPEWSAYQIKGASFHKTQDTAYMVFTNDEVLMPLWEKPGHVSLIRALSSRR